MSNLVADVINQALDAAGIDLSIGDPEEGTRESRVCLRAYGQCRDQLLRAAHWDRARKSGKLEMLADATGQTANVGTKVPAPGNFRYEYAMPQDALKIRFVPQHRNQQGTDIPTGNIAIPSTPIVSNLSQPPAGLDRINPARFLVAIDYNYPFEIQPGTAWWEIPNVSPDGRVVILTNVRDASAIYTAKMTYPNMWDPMFRAALVAYLASEIALPLAKDKKFGLAMRAQNIAIAKDKLQHARATDGNEGGPGTSDIRVDWIDIRYTGGGFTGAGRGGVDSGFGQFYGAWDSLSLADGAVF